MEKIKQKLKPTLKSKTLRKNPRSKKELELTKKEEAFRPKKTY